MTNDWYGQPTANISEFIYTDWYDFYVIFVLYTATVVT